VGRVVRRRLFPLSPEGRLQRETRTLPIVFLIVVDPVGSGFVAGLPRPGGNITGFINVEPEMGGKWLEMLKEIAPRMSRVAMILSDLSHVGRRAAHGRAECAAPTGCAALAERMGVDRAYVSGLELGQRDPTVVTLWHIAEALGVRLQSFFVYGWRVAYASMAALRSGLSIRIVRTRDQKSPSRWGG
jgi:transcriptional regulator with XRE-family HTH domain